MRFLQRYPRFLEFVYGATIALLRPLRPIMKPGGRVEWLFVRTERLTKGPMFDCRMCGQCVLHSTGMTCPQTCPKNLRNGPCGGVRTNGNCEVIADMPCIWVKAWERSQAMPKYGSGILNILPPLDRRLEMTSAWVNDFSGKNDEVPVGCKE
jgi:hypothetical protein